MNAADLRNHKSKELAQMARQAGVLGWHSMRKEELISALLSRKKLSSEEPRSKSTPAPSPTPRKTKSRKASLASRKLAELQQQKQRLHNLSTDHRKVASEDHASVQQDRLVLMVRDPYWLHACWELRSTSIDRARTALAQQWHTARPVLRVHRLDKSGSTVSTRQLLIHGGVCNWYVDVSNPPSRYKAEIGYVATDGEFYCIARSNDVVTPAHSSASYADENWTDVARNADQIYAMSGGYSADGASLELQEMLEKRLRRRMGRPSETQINSAHQEGDPLDFSLDAELLVYGVAHPHAHVTVQGEPISLNEDGSFHVKLPLPDRRQVIPVVAASADGTEQRTIILGVERNTKMLADTRREAPPR